MVHTQVACERRTAGGILGKRSTVIVSLPDGRKAHSSGTIYAVCS